MICDNLSVNNGILHFAGQNVIELAKKYGTPLYLLDEDKIREKCNLFKNAFKENFGDKAFPIYASKANCFKYIYKIMKEENMGIDVVSSGEIYTAKLAGFDLSKVYFNSNNKTDEDVKYAIENGVGYFIADNIEEIDAIDEEAKKQGVLQKVFLRLTPGIDPHTYEADATGKIDSKFGQAIETNQAEEFLIYTLQKKNIKVVGFHCHVGSQVFEEDVFEQSAIIMLEFMAKMKNDYGFITEQLDLGGGYGVRYVEADPYLDISKKVSEVAKVVKDTCKKLNINIPEIHMEPGRAIVADAGMTIYTVGTVKKIKGYKNYVSVDGGMSDNPRYALYKAGYTCLLANKMDEECNFKASIVGRCCESGDIIQEDVMLPESVKRYDLIAVCTTGAYHYSMASNYNRLPIPNTVMLKNGENFEIIKRQTFEDIVKNEL